MSETGRESPADAPGAALAAARKAQNLSVADAARQLKLSVHQIEALEAGSFDKLPGPIFVRGFMRNYARLLRLDAEEVLRSVSSDIPPPPLVEGAPASTEIPFPPARSRRWPHYAIAGLLLIGAVAVYEFYWLGNELTEVKPAPVAGVADRTPVTPMTPATPITPLTPVAVTGEAAQPAAAAAAQEAKTADEPPTAATREAAVTAAPGEDDRSPKPGQHQVLLAFDQASWVNIRDGSGKVIFSRLNQPGTEQRVYGVPPLSLVIGNAPGVRLSYDGSSVDLQQYTMKLNVARLTLK